MFLTAAYYVWAKPPYVRIKNEEQQSSIEKDSVPNYKLSMRKALFVTFEGLEGSGKSSQIANVADHFTKKNLRVIQTREPGGTPLAEKIRDLILHHQEELLSSRAELLLMLAARAQHVEELIKKNMETADLILCDRFTDSTLAYQGGGRQMDMQHLIDLNNIATGNVAPDLTFLMDLKVEDSQARIEHRKKRKTGSQPIDRFESETIAFHQRVRDVYLSLAKNEPQRVIVFNAVEKPQHLLQKMIDEINQRLNR